MSRLREHYKTTKAMAPPDNYRGIAFVVFRLFTRGGNNQYREFIMLVADEEFIAAKNGSGRSVGAQNFVANKCKPDNCRRGKTSFNKKSPDIPGIFIIAHSQGLCLRKIPAGGNRIHA